MVFPMPAGRRGCFRKFDNVVLSPHTAGLTEECTARMSLRCAQSVLDCFDGKLDPALVVNREVMAPA